MMSTTPLQQNILTSQIKWLCNCQSQEEQEGLHREQKTIKITKKQQKKIISRNFTQSINPKNREKINLYELLTNQNYFQFKNHLRHRNQECLAEDQDNYNRTNVQELKLSQSFSTVALFPKSQTSSTILKRLKTSYSPQKSKKKYLTLVSSKKNFSESTQEK